MTIEQLPETQSVENVSPYVSYLTQRLAPEDIVQVCSELSRLECRVKPLRDSVLLAGVEAARAGYT